MKGYLLIALFFLLPVGLSAQEYHGTTGLLHVPSAEMDSAGTFRGGISYLDKRFLPEQLWYYGDGIPFNAPAYTIGITFFPWLELSYSATLVKIHPDDDPTRPLGYYNEDRHFNVKVRPLKEGKWWPAVAIGWDDIGNLSSLKIAKGWTSNNFFENLYGVVSKNFDVKRHRICAHLAYRYYPSERNRDRRGIAAGITYTPRMGRRLQGPRAWLQSPRIILEWDGTGVNAGGDLLLWQHLFLQAALIHGKGLMCGMSYHYRIPFGTDPLTTSNINRSLYEPNARVSRTTISYPLFECSHAGLCRMFLPAAAPR